MSKRFQKSFIRKFLESDRTIRADLLRKSLPIHTTIAEWLADHATIDQSGKLSPGPSPARSIWDQTLDAVEKVFFIPKHDIVGRGRTKRLVLPRHVAMMIANLRGLSYSEIGQATTPMRDHTSVRYAAIRIVRQIKTDLILREQLVKTIQLLGISDGQLKVYENMMKA